MEARAGTVVDGTPMFVFVTCQVGAEPAVKREIAHHHSGWRFSYSRPGFLTFKLPTERSSEAAFTDERSRLRSVFARAWSISLGRVSNGNRDELAYQVWQLADQLPVDRLHVWPRDLAAPGQRGFSPGVSDASRAAEQAIVRAAPAAVRGQTWCQQLTDATRRGETVLDCVVVAADEWWVGWHVAHNRASCWPGGFWAGRVPEDAVSRAYAKISEALDWSALPIKPGQRCVDVGCAPGGGSQALLDRGLRVVGIDPADVDPRVLARQDFRHMRQRGADLKRREYREFQWLVADMNVVPREALAVVRDIVTHRLVNIRGLIMNLKLSDWDMAVQVDDFLAEVRSWGYQQVRARQLSQNRLEVCVAARKSHWTTRRRGHARRRRWARSAIKGSGSAANRA